MIEEVESVKARSIVLSGVILAGLADTLGGGMEARQRTGFMKRVRVYDGWSVVNDNVMGGVSQSRAELTDRETLRFTGTVSLENNGGFASIRHDSHAFEIGSGSGIRIVVRGDGRTYQLRVRASDGYYGIAHKADFLTVEGEWQELRIPWDRFSATYRGQAVPGAPELKGEDVFEVGFLIADGQAGPFNLEIAAIEAFEMDP